MKAYKVRIVVQSVEVDAFGGSRVMSERTAITIPVGIGSDCIRGIRETTLREVAEALRTVVDVDALVGAVTK